MMEKSIVQFDASNIDHRIEYKKYLQFDSWGKCKYIFTAPKGTYNLLAYIEKSILEYYLKGEFE